MSAEVIVPEAALCFDLSDIAIALAKQVMTQSDGRPTLLPVVAEELRSAFGSTLSGNPHASNYEAWVDADKKSRHYDAEAPAPRLYVAGTNEDKEPMHTTLPR